MNTGHRKNTDNTTEEMKITENTLKQLNVAVIFGEKLKSVENTTNERKVTEIF